MILPQNVDKITIQSGDESSSQPLHPMADYFSIQIYAIGDLVNSIYHANDNYLMSMNELMDPKSRYTITVEVENQPLNTTYVALYRIYNGGGMSGKLKREMMDPNPETWWSGIPPITKINGQSISLCPLPQRKWPIVYTNHTTDIIPETGTVCEINNQFTFTPIPDNSLKNYDANYMIACIQPQTVYWIKIKVPEIGCNISEIGDVRYASLNIISTVSPRPTIETYSINCREKYFTKRIIVDETVPMPALLYRQILPNPDFKFSIQIAHDDCYNENTKYVDNDCIKSTMNQYYPEILVI
jgi:hypothetical protein